MNLARPFKAGTQRTQSSRRVATLCSGPRQAIKPIGHHSSFAGIDELDAVALILERTREDKILPLTVLTLVLIFRSITRIALAVAIPIVLVQVRG
ncbi:MAG TPA: hypothetical protein VJU86_18070 [Pyrinomonadaceae bacterium]|nr:hypothetical protein [Pyrinomonadaceae bacterium]